ncbi:hypothetical protein [Nocardia sp. NPDC050793]|uniref:hypothetical protein n=1 Tax=Nocardia sp. NPDC050793 TaxID=3155159 RepID=UPI0033E2A310
MTVIAAMALPLPNRVIMGCDTATDHGGTFVYSKRGKIGVHQASNGERVLIGSAGNASAGRMLDRCLTIEATPEDPDDIDAADRWAGALAEAITGILADANPPLTVSHSDNASGIDADVLVAWRHHVWLLFAHAAIRPTGGIVAIGSGRDIALGSLYTAARSVTNPKGMMADAIELACKFDRGCSVDERGPIVISTVDDDA